MTGWHKSAFSQTDRIDVKVQLSFGPKLVSSQAKRHAKTLQVSPTAQLALIQACLHAKWCILVI